MTKPRLLDIDRARIRRAQQRLARAATRDESVKANWDLQMLAAVALTRAGLNPKRHTVDRATLEVRARRD